MSLVHSSGRAGRLGAKPGTRAKSRPVRAIDNASWHAATRRVLHHNIKVPTELVIDPGTGYWRLRYHHCLAKMKWDPASFDKHLKN